MSWFPPAGDCTSREPAPRAELWDWMGNRRKGRARNPIRQRVTTDFPASPEAIYAFSQAIRSLSRSRSELWLSARL